MFVTMMIGTMAFDASSHPLVTGHPPAWASEWGQDRYGVWVAFEVRGVTQRMRWIPPGRFIMGSPADEPERWDRELAHQVTISRGFWLADTACTQKLWEAVMGENPSGFKGSERPVETVSWDDCKGMISRLNQLAPGLDLRLPTEAEWEYACRAGTTTPFSFGTNITTDQVNYDGDFPYAGGKKGIDRGETVDVASLPPNPWGLYEMHGNVWEWCEDWFGEYPTDPQVDPVGPGQGSDRVLRGGSWISFARGVRSASRGRDWPDARGSSTGFRLARGQE
jgi:formylglycine-generating enzyme required for sulfatase activity